MLETVAFGERFFIIGLQGGLVEFLEMVACHTVFYWCWSCCMRNSLKFYQYLWGSKLMLLLYSQGGSGLKNIFDDLIFFLAVRTKVKEILELLTNDERLREERKKARKLKDKYVGVSGGGFGEYFVNTDIV